jgi:hypothetical protein
MMLANLVQAILSTILGLNAKGTVWEIVSTAFILSLFFIILLFTTVFLYIAGLVVVGKKRAFLTDAFIISLFGTLLSTLFLMFIPYLLIKLFLFIFVWLLLIKRLYKIGWLGAIAVAIVAVMIFLAITIILALFFQMLEEIMKLLFPLFVSNL